MTLPPGGPYRLDPDMIEQAVGSFEGLTVTLAPPADRAVLFLDGQPLHTYRTLSRAEVGRIQAFVGDGQAVTVGLLPFTDAEPVEEPLRIRCINPFF